MGAEIHRLTGDRGGGGGGGGERSRALIGRGRRLQAKAITSQEGLHQNEILRPMTCRRATRRPTRRATRAGFTRS